MVPSVPKIPIRLDWVQVSSCSTVGELPQYSFCGNSIGPFEWYVSAFKAVLQAKK